MTEMVTSGSMSGDEKRGDGLLGESDPERTPLAVGAAGPVRHRARPRLYQQPPRSLVTRASKDRRLMEALARPLDGPEIEVTAKADRKSVV